MTFSYPSPSWYLKLPNVLVGTTWIPWGLFWYVLLTGHFHFATSFSHIKLQKASPSKQWTCLHFFPLTGVTIREWVRGQNKEMSMDSSFASEWDNNFWCSCCLVCAAGTRSVTLRRSIIWLKLHQDKRNNITKYILFSWSTWQIH